MVGFSSRRRILRVSRKHSGLRLCIWLAIFSAWTRRIREEQIILTGNSLNNIDENLRAVDKYQSIWNRGMNSNNSTGATGVFRHKSWGKYTGKLKAQIMHVGMIINLGVYDTLEEGSRWLSDEAALWLFGEFVRAKK